ncbi:MAG: alpha/beta fold hydrolase, partial [Acidimicrobiia bacterium]
MAVQRSSEPPREATVVLVHGGFLGAWVWADVTRALEAQGIRVVAVDLPSVAPESEDDAHDGDLYADAAAVRQVLDAATPPVLLCGHSAGGAAITEAAVGPHPAVRRLVYLAAAVPDRGDSLTSLMALAAGGTEQQPDAGAEPVVMRPDGRAQLKREEAAAALFHDCTPARARAGLERLRPMNPVGATQPLTGAAWRELPATLVRGTLDRMPEAIAPAFFEFDPEIIEIPTGHCPNWTQPELVAEILASRAAGPPTS